MPRTNDAVRDDLQRFLDRLSASLSTAAKESLTAVAKSVSVAGGHDILVEGEHSDALYLIFQGRVGIYRRDNEGESNLLVMEMGPGEPFGEMALLDGMPRSATVRAETDCELIEIAPEALCEHPDGKAHLAEFKGALAAFVTQRVRNTTAQHVASLKRELALKDEQQQFGRFFVYSLIMMCLGTLVNNLIARTIVDVDVYTERFAWLYLAVLLVPSFFVIRQMNIPVSALGITKVGLKRSLIEGAVFAAALMVFAYGLAAVLKAFGKVPGKPLPFDLLGTLSYFFHSALQEIVARGFLQSSFQRFLGSKNGAWSVLLASILFGMFHLHFGFAAVAMTIVTGCVLGWVYMRHQNLAGVILIHYFMGVAAFNAGLV